MKTPADQYTGPGRARGRRASGNAKRNAILFVVLVCLSFVGMGCWSLWKARTLQMQEAATATANMNQALAQHVDDTVRAADTMLLGMVERLEFDGMNDASLPRLHALLKASVTHLIALDGLFVYDQDGRWIVSSRHSTPNGANNADREYFKYHKLNLDLGAHIGVPVVSRSSGHWVIPVSRRLNHADGTFAGVVLATIDMDYFRKFHESFEIGRNGTIMVALDNGTMLLRRPFRADVIGINVSHGPVFTQLAAHGPGTTLLLSRVDKIVRLYSYVHVRHYPLVVATGLARDDIFAGWRQEAWRTVAVILFLIAVLSGVGLHLVRQISVRERAEADLREARDTLERLNRSLELLTLEDSLTGLGNRRRFDMALQVECAHSERYRTALSLVMIDVDHFKRYNDLYGHPDGDACLRRVGSAVSSARGRACDVVARYGGEEIAVLLPQTGADGALAAAERIRQAVEAMAISHAGSPAGCVTVSIGVATLRLGGDADLSARLVQAADRALYEAKAAGRNQCRQADQAELADAVLFAGSL